MRIVVAPDSFKESMDAVTAADSIVAGVQDAGTRGRHPDCISVPLADGGEGTAVTLTTALGGSLTDVACTDALGRPRTGRIGLITSGGRTTAVVETAEANGLALIAPGDRDVLSSTTLGVATLIRAALDAGASEIIAGVGGSATTDGGAGMLVGLGARLLDADGRGVDPRPGDLHRVTAVDFTDLDPRLTGESAVRITVASDVTSPLTGRDGAATVFGPQKGASDAEVDTLDTALTNLADRVEDASGRPGLRDTPGAGAAGGLGFALLALGADLRPGFEVVAEAVDLRSKVAAADLVLTGEGRVDGQTSTGKVPAGVARIAADHGVPVVVLAGSVAEDADTLLGTGGSSGVLALVPILQGPCSLEDALADGPANIRRATATTMRLISSTLPDDVAVSPTIR